jgi:gliding motility-associated-like protein
VPKNKLIGFLISVTIFANTFAQTYSPIPSTGYNIDAIAETAPNSQALTTQSLDASNNVMYSANFAAGMGWPGGIINSGTIVSGTRTYQLRAFNTTNALYVATGTTKVLTVTTPSQFSKISLLIFSTEGASNINITFTYTNATTTNFGAFNIADWFGGAGSVYCCFGRCTRVTAGATQDGTPTDPNFYSLDFSLSCADQQKSLQSITINTTTGNQGAYVMAISGVAFTQTNTVTPVVNVSCNGGTNGSATASITGINSPFTYSWNSAPVQTTATASNLPAGNYTCTVTDNKGCTSTTTVTITQPPVLTLALTPTNASCGLNNGNISAAGGGGTPPYNYSINGGGFSAASSFPGLGAGTYTIAVKDNNGCQTSATANITASASPNVTVNSATICNGSSTTLTANGATTYTWSPATGLSSVNGTTVTANPATTTVYTVSGSTGACSGTATSTVTVNPSPIVTVNSATLCVGNSATLTANGAATYSWANATGLTATTGNSVTANPGTTTVYTITGTIGTCSSSTTSTVTINPLPTITVNSASICSTQQTATLTAGGANTYTWNSGTGLSSTTGVSVTATPTATTSYTITGTDVNGCVSTGTSTVTVNALPVINLTNGFICNGSSVTLNANGAVTYTWSPAGSLSSANGNNVIASPVATTNYTVVGTDANGCFNSDTTRVTVVNNPTVTVASATLCAGSSTTLTANGSVTYVWGHAAGLSATSGTSVTANPVTTTVYTITGTVGTCTAVTTATVTVNNLPVITVTSGTICLSQQTATLTATGASSYSWSPGTGLSSVNGSTVNAVPNVTTNYTVTGTDVNGCVNTATTSVTVNALPNINVNSGLICNGGSLALNANGANTYTWSPGTGLSSTNGNSVNANPITTTVYTISGTDVNNCTATATSTVTVVNNPTVSVNNASICSGQQTATLTASGATTYSWSPANGLSATTGSNVNANPNVTTSYTITGTIGTCTAVTTCTVQVNTPPTITASSTVICNTSSATLNANGAATYTWSTLATGNSITVSPNTTTTYSVAGTDGNGCKNFTTATVTVNPLPNVMVNSGAVCAGNQIILNANNAVVCTWSPATGLSSAVGNSVNANPNTSTQYTVTGTDGNGCSNTALSTVTVHPLPNVTVNSATICKGKNATLSANGANSYNWNPSTGLSSSTQQSPTASPNTSTTYTVTGTDINNCRDTAVTTVTVNQLPVAFVTPPQTSGCVPLCVNFSNNGTTSTSATYNWNFGNGTTSTSQAAQSCYANAGTYTTTLLVTDSNGCRNTSSAIVTAYPIPKANFSFSPGSTTILNPEIQFYDLSTNAPINTWQWYFGDGDSSHIQNPQHSYADTGLYYPHLTVFSINGCWDIIWETLYIAPEYLLYVPNAFTPNDDNTNDIFLPKGEGITEYTLLIFDRWGNQIFKSTDIGTGWDGKKNNEYVQQDVYAWKIEVRNIKGEPKHLAGIVSLLK